LNYRFEEEGCPFIAFGVQQSGPPGPKESLLALARRWRYASQALLILPIRPDILIASLLCLLLAFIMLSLLFYS
jgi:hypothetical protein